MQVGWNATFIGTAKEIFRLGGTQGNKYNQFILIINSLGFYAGYFSLLLREIPFSCIQFSIYEYMKKKSLEKYHTIDVSQSAWNGFVSASMGLSLLLSIF